MKLEKKLGYEKISKLLLSLAIPSIIAQLVNVLYNMVDRIYIGQMSDGTLAMASLSVALPILTFVTAFTNLVGVGGAPLCAIRMGEKRQDKAEEIMTNSFVMLIGLGFILTIIILIFKEPLLLLFGANEETLPQAISYISIYALGTVFVQITLGMNAYINTQGFAKMGMCTVRSYFKYYIRSNFYFWTKHGCIWGCFSNNSCSRCFSIMGIGIFIWKEKYNKN